MKHRTIERYVDPDADWRTYRDAGIEVLALLQTEINGALEVLNAKARSLEDELTQTKLEISRLLSLSNSQHVLVICRIVGAIREVRRNNKQPPMTNGYPDPRG